MAEWGMENERLGLVADLTDTWTPEQRERFLSNWQDDESLLQIGRGQKRSYEKTGTNDESLVDSNREQAEEVINDGAGTSTDEIGDNSVFTETDVKQVKVKKFNTTGTDYTVQFTDTFSQLELSQYHDRLHEIFESLLNTVTVDIPVNDQVRFVFQSPLLEHPISLPFMPRQRLTTERVLAEIERVIQSNHEFRLNDSVNVNLIHVEMPHWGTRTKRSKINLKKARAPVVSVSKIENDKKYRSITDSRWSMQTRLAKELHEKAEVPLWACGLNEVKQFQIYLSDYQINIVSKEHQNSILYSGPESEKRIYLYFHNDQYDVITSMPAFFARKRYCHTSKKAYDHKFGPFTSRVMQSMSFSKLSHCFVD